MSGCEFDGCDYDEAQARDFEFWVVAALKRIEERLEHLGAVVETDRLDDA